MLDRSHPRAVTDLVSRLVDALTGRGLVAEPFGASMVWVVNRAADLPEGDPLQARTGPSLRQMVICRADDTDELCWWWVWTGRDGDPEFERLCPGIEITVAVNAIVRVLAARTNSADAQAGV